MQYEFLWWWRVGDCDGIGDGNDNGDHNDDRRGCDDVNDDVSCGSDANKNNDGDNCNMKVRNTWWLSWLDLLFCCVFHCNFYNIEILFNSKPPRFHCVFFIMNSITK